ncbi:MAG: dUTP diphosphatase [Candidatus Omnitrophota bacterium]
MKIKIKRLDQSLPLPQYHTPGSVAFDLSAREDATINPKEIKLIPTGLIVQTPPGYMLMLSSRSSLAIKKGLMMGNGVGIIDQDYCGPEDEIKIQLVNITEQPVEIKKGERLAQGMFVRVDTGEFEEVESLEKNSRGGFGGTGGYK